MKIFAISALIVLLFLVGVQIWSLAKQEHELGEALSDTQARLATAQANEANLSADVQYLQNPVNLEKELQAQFNYKKPGENMIIIVPSTTSTSGQ